MDRPASQASWSTESRPYSRDGRFLQDTALKLGDDASRCGTAATLRDEQLMRSSFLAEAASCIRSLQAIFEQANGSTFVSRLDDWRKIDLKATAQLQQHVKSLSKLNETVEDFLARCAGVEVFHDFQRTMTRLSEAVSEMEDFRADFQKSVELIAKGVAEKVAVALKKDAESRSAWLHCQLEKHSEEQERLSATQRKIWNRLESMGKSMQEQLLATKLQEDQMEKLLECQKGVGTDCKSLLELQQRVFNSFRNSSEQQGAMHDNIFGSISKEIRSMNGYILESLGWNADAPPLAESLRHLEAQMADLDARSLSQMQEQRNEVTRLELALKEQEHVLQRSEALKEESVASQLAMKAELSKTSQVLEDVRLQLQDARTASMLNSMRRLMEIEARGNMRLDRQSGRMAPVKPMDFRPSEPSKEAYLVTFANDSDVAKVLADMLEVTNIFDAGLQVSVSCKQGRGDATKRATLVKEYMVMCGRPPERISVQGSVGVTEISVQLQDDKIFPSKVVPAAKSKSKSPGRR